MRPPQRGRDVFWRQLLAMTTPSSVLEVGCNVGGNLHWLVDLLPGANIAAVDVNQHAVDRVLAAYSSVDTHQARRLRFHSPIGASTSFSRPVS